MIFAIKITEIPTCMTLNDTQQKELVSFYSTIELIKVLCHVIKIFRVCSETARST